MQVWLIIIIINGIMTLLFAFAAYIWRNLEGRVKGMEVNEDNLKIKLIDHPLLTVEGHQFICNRTITELKGSFEIGTERLLEHIEGVEKRTGLLIENAILKAGRENGKK